MKKPGGYGLASSWAGCPQTGKRPVLLGVFGSPRRVFWILVRLLGAIYRVERHASASDKAERALRPYSRSRTIRWCCGALIDKTHDRSLSSNPFLPPFPCKAVSRPHQFLVGA